MNKKIYNEEKQTAYQQSNNSWIVYKATNIPNTLKRWKTVKGVPSGIPIKTVTKKNGIHICTPTRLCRAITPVKPVELNLLKYAQWPEDNGKKIRKLLRKRTLLITSDGSYKDNISSFGFC